MAGLTSLCFMQLLQNRPCFLFLPSLPIAQCKTANQMQSSVKLLPQLSNNKVCKTTEERNTFRLPECKSMYEIFHVRVCFLHGQSIRVCCSSKTPRGLGVRHIELLLYYYYGVITANYSNG